MGRAEAHGRESGNQTRAAQVLGISRDQLRYRLKKLEETQLADRRRGDVIFLVQDYRLSLRDQGGVVVQDQTPTPLLSYPHAGKAVVAGNSFPFVLPNHCGPASFHRRIRIDANLNFVGRNRLEFQVA